MMFMWFSWGLTTAQNSIRTTSDLHRSRLTNTRSAENDQIGADTDPEYRIDASLVKIVQIENWSNVLRKSRCNFFAISPSNIIFF